MANLEERARMHAALGEPVRLAIVDHLAVGDASPGELGRTLGLATNLLAHHLRVLEESGLVRRVRSEGDRRRSYVQLVLDDPLVQSLTSYRPAGGQAAADRVVFVCTRNSARSQLAAAAWKAASSIPSTSAGTHPASRVHPRAVAVGRRHGLDLDATATANVRDVSRPGDLMVAVCDNAYEELPFGQAQLHWAVPDPVPAGTMRAFEAACQQITQRVGRLARALQDTAPSPS